MALDVTPTLRKALHQLETERAQLDRQISLIQAVLGGQNTAPKARRRRMSPAARRAVGRRMKAYWAKRRAEKSKKSPKASPVSASKKK
jgi:hypothetical protein